MTKAPWLFSVPLVDFIAYLPAQSLLNYSNQIAWMSMALRREPWHLKSSVFPHGTVFQDISKTIPYLQGIIWSRANMRARDAAIVEAYGELLFRFTVLFVRLEQLNNKRRISTSHGRRIYGTMLAVFIVKTVSIAGLVAGIIRTAGDTFAYHLQPGFSPLRRDLSNSIIKETWRWKNQHPLLTGGLDGAIHFNKLIAKSNRRLGPTSTRQNARRQARR